MKSPYTTIRAVRVTEKSTALTAHDQYVFVVDPRANKREIKEAVEMLFDRKVATVNVINCAGKLRRTRRGTGRRANWKKAMVKLKRGQERIEFF